MTKIKICGNTNKEDVALAIDLGADFLGFIFTESKRKITPDQAKTIMAHFPKYNNFVGVFANQPKAEAEKVAKELKLSWLQFHGEETSRYCHHFMEQGFKVIKTFRVKDDMSLKRIEEYNVDAFLFDTYSKNAMGGTGKTFDWSILEEKPYINEKLFLAGGLNVNNVEEAIQKIKPYAVDVASGVEKQPGIKDPNLLKEFIKRVKGTAAVKK